ncbi:cell division protein FtsZ [Flavihumibacter petaseus]|uniref:Cell division protein FtsZ n=1 Tax=Flavihumibacter petaseus NBRC 106054 TaxID=1220578 RepID=A0A0E9N4S5_9BACT|nr:cell division protein FtsZ [Flavihumibacter petaseus]GAO44952.1 cell division protein FtsZ [Flavihumibacter petaseus NBRC 106054]
MIHFDLPKEKSSIIKVIGVGGGGSNAVNHMFSQSIDGVNFIICNTDAQAIALSKVPNKIQLGPHLTQGLGAGANPEIGKQATEESLEEIKRILEVNTKMAFITAGMGGGTGTGGAPIISKICKDLGILTVGIVTTPFSYEGRKRQIQAEDGIQKLKENVDTLLVISNDKLRHQYGNLKMKDAFAKADNVLATAAKCITDVISSTGQINVDFADVCTVMRNGGVAILGNASAAGENRAQVAIEEALNSPLLNDNDIRGARWILININSAEGENEFTMDEVDIIQNYLLSHAGEDTDVILGLGYDNTLGNEIGITLIATGFEYRDPFVRKSAVKLPEVKKEEKILMTLGQKAEEPKTYDQSVLPFGADHLEKPANSGYGANGTIVHNIFNGVNAPVQEKPAVPLVAPAPAPVVELPQELQPRLVEPEMPAPQPKVVFFSEDYDRKSTVENLSSNSPVAGVDSSAFSTVPPEEKIIIKLSENNSPVSAASGGYLAKPSNIYAEPAETPITPVSEPVHQQLPAMPQKTEDPAFDMQLVIKDETPAADKPGAPSTQPTFRSPVEEPAMPDEAEEQKRKAAERIQKLRNLSFNINAADPNNEFDTVPAYIRRNLELYNTVSPAENFYSNYTVKTDDQNNTQISTINTFLDGKKPD